MELTKSQIKTTKGIAIIFMLLLHLFCTKSYEGLYTPIILIGSIPLVYYLALFGSSQFPFIVGFIFAHKKIYSKLYNLANKIRFKNLLGIMLIILMIVSTWNSSNFICCCIYRDSIYMYF